MAYTPVTAELLREIRRKQGRKLHEARHLTLIQGGLKEPEGSEEQNP